MQTDNRVATRDAYGEALAELGAKNENIVVLDADVSPSTKTSVSAKKFPSRFFDMGIAEQNMIGTAVGLSFAGKIPFCSSFAMFAVGRAFEQVRNMVAHQNANVKICATHAGLSVGEDGASHQALEDIACMRAIPKMKVLNPCDVTSTKKIIEKIASDFGPTYVRLSRPKSSLVYDDAYEFEFGKGTIVEDGNDIAIFATGLEVVESLKAREELKKQSIDCAVIDIASIKPLDTQLIEKYARKCGAIVTAEEHNIIGGLGSAVCETVCEKYPVPVYRIGTRDTFGESGRSEELFVKYGLDANAIAQSALLLKKLR